MIDRHRHLEALSEASAIHARHQSRERVEEHPGPIDVQSILGEMGISVLFQPLDNLLGAYVRQQSGSGILVTTRRSLHLQRFTAAHELGHLVLGHEQSLDSEVGIWGEPGRDPQEASADVFAAELLMPKWLYVLHAKRHGWSRQKLAVPDIVYQLSLRMGVSYDATCVGLEAQGILPASTVRLLRKEKPKSCKVRALGNISLDDYRANVWVMDEGDDGGQCMAGPGDVFVFTLVELTGSGYVWTVEPLLEAGFNVLDDSRVSAAASVEAVGAGCVRRLVVRAPSPASCAVALEQRRPWTNAAEPLKTLTLYLETFGAEISGFSRHHRRALGLSLAA